ncbi:MAG: hypothetical protein GF332_00250 [Candidatus Moranbacteria bacterium]|nr:hypothetical protein [Candidatus Moranbacteria bacterium]
MQKIFKKWKLLLGLGFLISIAGLILSVYLNKYIGMGVEFLGLALLFIGAIQGADQFQANENQKSEQQKRQARQTIKKIKIPWAKYFLLAAILIIVAQFFNILLIRIAVYFIATVFFIAAASGLQEKFSSHNKKTRTPKDKTIQR